MFDWVWHNNTVDGVAVGSLIIAAAGGLIYLVVALVRRWVFKRKLPQNLIAKLAAGLAVLVGVYLTYATFRNEARQTAENGLTEIAYKLLEIEMADPSIRCLYRWGAFDEPSQCLQSNIDPAQWSKTQLYVENVFDFFDSAGWDGREWGADNVEGITKWADEVAADRTGLFSFYLVATYRSEARAVAEGFGVRVASLCANYRKVSDALTARGVAHERIECQGT